MESATRRGLPRAVVDDMFLAPVHINVGGTVYTTTLDTLTKYPDSKLSKLFDGTLAISVDPLSRQYFLDVNGSVFAHVLDFLRYGELLLPNNFSQLPLLTKLAEHFEIKDLIQALTDKGGEGNSETKDEESSVCKHLKQKCINIKSPGKICDGSESHLSTNSKLKPEHLKAGAVETDKITKGTCELGMVKIGTVEGGKVDFGMVEATAMKGKNLEFESTTTETLNIHNITVGTIQSETIEAKASNVDVLKSEHLISGTVETENIKAANVEMETVDAGLTKVEMMEVKAFKSQTVEMENVNAENVEIKSLKSETLKLKTLEVETLTGNFLMKGDKPESVSSVTAHSMSNVVLVLVHMTSTYSNLQISLLSTDEKVATGPLSRFNRSGEWGKSDLIKVFLILINLGYKLCSTRAYGERNLQCEYVFYASV